MVLFTGGRGREEHTQDHECHLGIMQLKRNTLEGHHLGFNCHAQPKVTLIHNTPQKDLTLLLIKAMVPVKSDVPRFLEMYEHIFGCDNVFVATGILQVGARDDAHSAIVPSVSTVHQLSQFTPFSQFGQYKKYSLYKKLPKQS